METITALTRQSLIDIAVQSLGDADMAQELAELNAMALTDDVEPGTILKLPVIADESVVRFFDTNGLRPASALEAEDMPEGGIDFMGIEINFIVS